MRDRVPDAICAGRIERFLERSARGDSAQLPDAHEALDMGIEWAVAEMEPLTRGILILVVGRKMSVLEVARLFHMSEERVCRHFRLAAQMVMKQHEQGDIT
jgi:AraC-like DNA-binding protein